MQAKDIKVDIKTDPRFKFTTGTDNNNHIVACTKCRFKHSNTFLGCTEAAELHAVSSHWPKA